MIRVRIECSGCMEDIADYEEAYCQNCVKSGIEQYPLTLVFPCGCKAKTSDLKTVIFPCLDSGCKFVTLVVE